MQTDKVGSPWSMQQAHQSQGKNGQDFASQMAQSSLSGSQPSGVKSGGQLLSDDMARALASYTPESGTPD